MDGINTGDTAWVLISTTLVLMTPALAFFYGGMVRKKNVLSTLNLSFILMALISIHRYFRFYIGASAPAWVAFSAVSTSWGCSM